MTNERIEAEIAAEVRRIEAWNDPELAHVVGSWLRPSAIRSLANHLCQSRLQVEDARVAALVAQAKVLVAALQRLADGEAGQNGGDVGADLDQASHAQEIAAAAIRRFKEVTP